MEYVGLAAAIPFLLIAAAFLVFWGQRKISIRRARRNFEGMKNSEKLDRVLTSQFRSDHSQFRDDKRSYR